MKKSKLQWKTPLASAAISLVLMMPATNAVADAPIFFPPQSSVLQQKFRELSAQWWQFVFSIPANVNPLFDENGDKCVVGQRGDIWFLVGVFNESGTVVRDDCTVPEGKALFFPIINTVAINTPNIEQGPENLTVAELRAQAAANADSATDLSVQVDGQFIDRLERRPKTFRIQSEVFEITAPADNIFSPILPAGTYSRVVDDGYYIMLKPLPVGPHMIRIRGRVPLVSFELDVTYNLHVVPVLRE